MVRMFMAEKGIDIARLLPSGWSVRAMLVGKWTGANAAVGDCRRAALGRTDISGRAAVALPPQNQPG
jgi:hypothetical protein